MLCLCFACARVQVAGVWVGVSEPRQVRVARPGENVCVRLAALGRSHGPVYGPRSSNPRGGPIAGPRGGPIAGPRGGPIAGLRAGAVLCAAGERACVATAALVADLHVLELPAFAPLLTAGYTCILHFCAAAVECTIVQLLYEDTGRAKVKHPPFVKSAARVVVHLQVAAPVALDLGPRAPTTLSHLTLRNHGHTIAFGRVVRALVPKVPKPGLGQRPSQGPGPGQGPGLGQGPGPGPGPGQGQGPGQRQGPGKGPGAVAADDGTAGGADAADDGTAGGADATDDGTAEAGNGTVGGIAGGADDAAHDGTAEAVDGADAADGSQ